MKYLSDNLTLLAREKGYHVYTNSITHQEIIDWFRETHELEIYAIKQIEEDEYGGIVC